VLETSIDTLPNYEPEQTILDDTVTKVTTEYDESYDTEDDVINTSLEDSCCQQHWLVWRLLVKHHFLWEKAEQTGYC
jgi:hypothetical protein